MTDPLKSYVESSRLRDWAQSLIPGGAHTYAKGDDQFPLESPGFIARGKGCRVWDVDGNEFIEYAMGLRSVTLGHAYPSVVDAAIEALRMGSNFNRPSPIEVECAQKIVDLIPCAEQVKFAKDGSTVVTAGVKLSRAATGRELVVICEDQPFFSYNDWFMGTTGMTAGVLADDSRKTKKFRYNDLESLEALFAAYPNEIAVVILEPARIEEPAPGFLEGVRSLCDRFGTILMFDEMVTGFRWHVRGAQHVYGVTPDLAALGKAMANGFSASALCGKKSIMELGGLEHNKERVFLLSTTHGGETHGLAAALEVMKVYENERVIEHLYSQGAKLRVGIESITSRLGLENHVPVMGRDCALYFGTRDDQGAPSQPLRTLLLQELIARGVLAPSLMVSYSHQDSDIDQTLVAFEGALEVIQGALRDGVDKFLVGPAVKPVYRSTN